jgi:hypothetical protein
MVHQNMLLHNNQYTPKLTGMSIPLPLQQVPVCRNSNNMVDMESLFQVDILPLSNTRIYTAELLILSTISRLQ